MKKILVFAMAAMLAGSAFAATGWFNDYFDVSVNGGAASTYELGFPSGGTWDGISLGSVYSLTLVDIDMSYWRNAGEDRAGGSFWYQIYEDGNPTPVVLAQEIIWTQTGPSGNDYNGTWSGSQNMLGAYSYVEDTTYYVQVWAKNWGTEGPGTLPGGDTFLNNNNDPANYEATFTYNAAPVPEPATMSLLGLGALAMVLRRKMSK